MAYQVVSYSTWVMNQAQCTMNGSDNPCRRRYSMRKFWKQRIFSVPVANTFVLSKTIVLFQFILSTA